MAENDWKDIDSDWKDVDPVVDFNQPKDMTEKIGLGISNMLGQGVPQNFLIGKRATESAIGSITNSVLPQQFQDFISKNMPQSAPNLRGVPSYMMTPDVNKQMASEDLLSLTSPVALSTLMIPAGKQLSKFKFNTPELVNKMGVGAANKIVSRMNFFRDQYRSTYEPFNKTYLPSEQTAPIVNEIPRGLRKVLDNFLGTKIVDAKGNPSYTVGDLKKLEWHLDDNIKTNDALLGRLRVSSQEIRNISDKIHSVVLKNLPEEIGVKVKTLDKAFSEMINPAQSALKKIAEVKNGKVIRAKTEYLTKVLGDAKFAGDQGLLTGLKAIGIDITPELARLRSFAKRQQFKKTIGRVGEKVVEYSILGKILGGGGQ